MPPESEVAILAPGVVREATLPRRWKRRGRFNDLSALDENELLGWAFGIRDASLPAAPLHYLAMTGSDPAGYCLYAYPVYLHARREQLILMAGPEFEPNEQEARELIASLREHFPEWRFERTDDAMWFIIADGDPELETTPLQKVLGENINDHLPRGRDAMAWIKALNELQMVLFDSKVNQERESAAQPPVNSLWFWGGGRLPDIRGSHWQRLVTNDPVALGIGRRMGIETCWLDVARSGAPGAPDIATGDSLWAYRNPDPSDEAASVLSAEQWSRLGRALQRREIGKLTLIEPGYGELTIDSGNRRSWLPWR